jgi:hypothetical protein
MGIELKKNIVLNKMEEELDQFRSLLLLLSNFQLPITFFVHNKQWLSKDELQKKMKLTEKGPAFSRKKSGGAPVLAETVRDFYQIMTTRYLPYTKNMIQEKATDTIIWTQTVATPFVYHQASNALDQAKYITTDIVVPFASNALDQAKYITTDIVVPFASNALDQAKHLTTDVIAPFLYHQGKYLANDVVAPSVVKAFGVLQHAIQRKKSMKKVGKTGSVPKNTIEDLLMNLSTLNLSQMYEVMGAIYEIYKQTPSSRDQVLMDIKKEEKKLFRYAEKKKLSNHPFLGELSSLLKQDLFDTLKESHQNALVLLNPDGQERMTMKEVHKALIVYGK